MATTETPDLKRTARRDCVIKHVLHSIFSGEAVGGDRLVEEDLALKLGVSRTPIREALRELANIGVISLKANHGAMVRPFGPTQLREIYQMRRLLESEAARLAGGQIDRDALQKIRDEMQSLIGANEHTADWSEKALLLDSGLHDLIARSAQCERLAEEIERYWRLAYVVGEAVRNESRTQDWAIQEHTAIIDCLLENDASGAGDAMSLHIDRRLEAAMNALCPTPSALAAPAPAPGQRGLR